MERTYVRQWLIAFAVMVLAVVVAYFFLDRPIAFYSYEHFAKKPWFDGLTRIQDWLWRIATLIFLLTGVWAFTGRMLPKPLAVVLMSSLSLVVASVIKEFLKYVFGRTWPETWTQNNPSLIGNGVFGFNPFHGGTGYESFPSGHTTVACAVVTVLWFCYPKFRALYVLLVAAIVVGLLGADYHFLSDIIAGGFLGTLNGWIVVRLWEIGALPPLSALSAIRASHDPGQQAG